MKHKLLLIALLSVIYLPLSSQTWEEEYKKMMDDMQGFETEYTENFEQYSEKRKKELKEFIENEKEWYAITMTTDNTTVKEIKRVIIKKKKTLPSHVIKNEKNPKHNVNITPPIVNPYEDNTTDENNSGKKSKKEVIKKKRFFPSICPVDDYRLSSRFGMRKHPIVKMRRFHYGIDMACPRGRKVYVTANGKVIRAGRARGYGNYIVVSHGNGLKTAYAHLSKIAVKKNQIVVQGEVIGFVGSTGVSSGPHLHYEVIKNGKKINPINFIPKRR